MTFTFSSHAGAFADLGIGADVSPNQLTTVTVPEPSGWLLLSLPLALALVYRPGRCGRRFVPLSASLS